MVFRTSLLLGVAVAMTACSGPEPAAPQATPARAETVFDPQAHSIDRAKGVQQTVDAQAAERRRQLEAAEK